MHHHLTFYTSHDNLPRVIELHWKLRSFNDTIVVRDLKNSKSFINTQWNNIYALNHLDQFIYLCIHGTEHAWYRLKWLMDIPMILKNVKFKWNDFENPLEELFDQTKENKKNRIYIVGSSIDLKERLGTYNKTCDHEVVFYKECKNEEHMDLSEKIILLMLDV